jgi:hypothetical protein
MGIPSLPSLFFYQSIIIILKNLSQLGTVAYAYNRSNQGSGDWEDGSSRLVQAKFYMNPISTEKVGCGGMYPSSQLWRRSVNRKIGSMLAYGQGEQVPTSKITRAKRAGGVAQTVECLPCKCKTVSSWNWRTSF